MFKRNGTIISTEWPFVVFDAIPIFAAMTVIITSLGMHTLANLTILDSLDFQYFSSGSFIASCQTIYLCVHDRFSGLIFILLFQATQIRIQPYFHSFINPYMLIIRPMVSDTVT